MKRIILFTFFTVFLFTNNICHAQSIVADPANVAVGLHSTQLPYYPFNIAKSETLDSATVSVTYKATYLDYSVKDGETKVDDIMCLQLGQNVSKFYSANLDNLDRFKTFKEKRTAKMRQNYLPYIIYRNEGEICVVNREPFEVDMVQEYSEKVKSPNWKILDETEKIIGYDCNKATAEFRGREWTVWFCTDLPFNNGPWKLQGLPGLILKAVNSTDEYSFEAIEIVQDTKAITKPLWKTNKTTYKKWKKLDQSYHKSPHFYFSKGGERKIFNALTSEDFTEDWTIPYNPIELK